MLAKAKGFWGRRLYVSHDPDYAVILLFAAIYSVLSTILSRLSAPDSGLFVSSVLANLGALVVIALIVVVFLASQRHRESGSSYSYLAIVLSGLFIGFVKWLLSSIILSLFRYSELVYDEPASNILSSSVSGVLLIGGLVLFSAIRASYSNRREFLVEALNEQEVISNPYPELLLDFLSSFRDRMLERKRRVSSRLLAQEIRALVSDVLRPLSQDIWKTEVKSLPSFGTGALFKAAFSKHVYFWPLVLPIFMITNIAAIPESRDGDLIWILLGARALILLLVLTVASRIVSNNLSEAVALYLGALVLIGALHLGASRLIAPVPLVEELQLLVLSQLWLALVTITVGVARALVTGGRSLDKAYSTWIGNQTTGQSSKDQLSAYENRQLAQYLHGTVQTKLSNLALHLEQGSEKADLEADLNQIDQVIREALTEFHSRRAKSFEELMLKLEDDWGGLIDLQFLVTEVSLTDQLLDTLSHAINEAVANAYRHGKATRVTVNLNEELELTVLDDGHGFGEIEPGLGSALFDSISTEWELTASEAGSLLRLKLTS